MRCTGISNAIVIMLCEKRKLNRYVTKSPIGYTCKINNNKKSEQKYTVLIVLLAIVNKYTCFIDAL